MERQAVAMERQAAALEQLAPLPNLLAQLVSTMGGESQSPDAFVAVERRLRLPSHRQKQGS